MIDLIEEAEKQGILTKVQAKNLQKAEDCRLDAIQVDFYSLDEYKTTMKTGL